LVIAGTVNMAITSTVSASDRYDGIACTATTGNSTANSLTAVGGCSVTAGQLAIMVFAHDTNNQSTLPTYSSPNGWTLLSETSVGTGSNQLTTRAYYQVASSDGDLTPTFTSPDKTRSTYMIAVFDSPDTGAPIADNGVVSGSAPSGGVITLPSKTASSDGSSLLGFAAQNIGSNSFVAPAGLATAAQASQGGNVVNMIIFTKDRIFSGPTPEFDVSTVQTTNAFVGGMIVINP
jgi:hypothetical protein